MNILTRLGAALLAGGLAVACAGQRPFVSYSHPHATLVTQNPVHENATSVFFISLEGNPGKVGNLISRQLKPGERLYPVNLLQVDDNNVSDPQLSYTIEPGEHEVVLSGVFDVDPGTMPTIRNNRVNTPHLNMNFEQGKRYYLGALVKGRKVKNWKPVVWKVEG